MAAKRKKSTGKKPARGARKPAAKSTAKHAPKSPQRQQPESLRLRSFSASLTVNDLTRSIAWYRDVLRFTPGERWEDGGVLRGIQMKAGLCDLMLSQDDFAKGRDRAKGDGVRLWISTAQDIPAIAARIKASGVKLDFEPRAMPWGDFAFAITDPDGYKITVVQEE
jgi:catechol 2,3-dioxygenase-like lactoylglutathione lyase family enzyme